MRRGRRVLRPLQMHFLRCLSRSSLGCSPKRDLPKWRRDFFTPRGQSDGDVVLFVDTFNNYFEPENARAALRVLEAAGYRACTRHGARCAADGRFSRPGWWTRRRKKRAGCSRRCALTSPRACRSSGWSLVPVLAARRVHRHGRRRRLKGACCSREFLAQKPGKLLEVQGAGAAGAAARPLPPEGVRRDAGGGEGARPGSGPQGLDGADELLRHGRQLRLRSRALRCFDEDGRAVAVAVHQKCSKDTCWSPTAPVAATRSAMAPAARRCTSRACSSARSRAAGSGRRRGTCRRRAA